MRRARSRLGWWSAWSCPYYLLGVGSFQMERMVRIGESGAEVLDRLPFEFDASGHQRMSSPPRRALKTPG